MKEFFAGLRKVGGQSVSAEIIEKDYRLHRLLHEISQSRLLKDCLVFKGGTCLIKAYAGYYRFSEDVDFTRRQDSDWLNSLGKSAARTGKRCSEEISKYLEEFKSISRRLALGFSGDKAKSFALGGDVDIHGGGKMVDFWLRYRSDVSEIPDKIKVQINLVDVIEFPVASMPLSSYVAGSDLDDLKFKYGEASDEYCRAIVYPCYDSREIFVEKCRAAMTRIVYKPRDVLDIYVMERKFGYSIAEYRPSIVKKTRYMLDMYSKYRDSFQSKEFPDEHVLTDAEKKLLLKSIPGDFGIEAVRIHNELKVLHKDILEGNV